MVQGSVATSVCSQLQAKDIAVGTLIWYSGFTSLSSWDCPAIIYSLNSEGRFLVMSLDDMKKQTQEYDLEVGEYSPTSRKTMRLASVAEVDAYLARNNRKTKAHSIIKKVQTAV